MADAAVFDATRLNVFREVVRRGSLSAAAQALSFTQPAVSRQIAALEREAGAQLLERTARGIRLTEPGRVLLGHAEAILDRMSAAHAQLESVGRMAGGRLRIGAFQTATATIVPRAIAAFAAAHPGVELSLVEAVSPAAVAALRAGTVDLAIVTYLPELVSADVAVVDLVDDELLVALPERHPLARRPRLRLRDLRDETWIEAEPRDTQPNCSPPSRGPRASSRACASSPSSGRRSRASSPRASASRSSPGSRSRPSATTSSCARSGPAPPGAASSSSLAAGYRAPAVEPFVDVLRSESAAHTAALAARARLLAGDDAGAAA